MGNKGDWLDWLGPQTSFDASGYAVFGVVCVLAGVVVGFVVGRWA